MQHMLKAAAALIMMRGALAMDFFIIFAEGCLFVALAALIGKANLFTGALIALLILDCAWGFLATLAFTGAQAQKAERKWSLINLLTAALLVFLYILVQKFFPAGTLIWK